MRTGYHHYHTLWQSLGSVGKSDDVYQDLIARYSEPQRGYHTVQHLNECLVAFDKAEGKGAIRNPNAAHGLCDAHFITSNAEAVALRISRCRTVTLPPRGIF